MKSQQDTTAYPVKQLKLETENFEFGEGYTAGVNKIGATILENYL